MGEYPAAVPTNEEHFIVGELYCLNHENEFSWAIEQLDDYEGVHGDVDEPPLYIRKTESIDTPNGQILAWMYWFNGSVEHKPIITSGDVLEYIKSKL